MRYAILRVLRAVSRERGVGPSAIQQERPRGRPSRSPAVTKPDHSYEHEFAAFTNGRSSPLGNGTVARVLFDALMNSVRRLFDKRKTLGPNAAFRLAQRVTASIRPQACTRASEVSESSHREWLGCPAHPWRSERNWRSLARAAGSFATGSPLPQALIQCRQRLICELRLCKLVILSWPAPQPVAGDSAVAQPATAFVICLVRAPAPTGDTASRHIPCALTTPRRQAACRGMWRCAPARSGSDQGR